MTKTRSRFAPLLLAAALVVGAGACSASTTTETVTSDDAAAAAATVVATVPTATVAAPTAVPVEPEGDESSTDEDPVPAEEVLAEEAEVAVGADAPATTGGTVEIAFDDGRTWSLATVDCYVVPDAPFGIFFMTGVNDDGADFGAVESWPLDGDKTGGTSFISTFWDEEGNLYGIEGGPVTDNGGALSFSSRIYEGLALEPTLNGTFSCTP